MIGVLLKQYFQNFQIFNLLIFFSFFERVSLGFRFKVEANRLKIYLEIIFLYTNLSKNEKVSLSLNLVLKQVQNTLNLTKTVTVAFRVF